MNGISETSLMRTLAALFKLALTLSNKLVSLYTVNLTVLGVLDLRNMRPIGRFVFTLNS